MNISPEALRELHRIHRQLADLRERLEAGPKQVRASEAHIKKCEGELQQAKDHLQKARLAADEKQLQLRQREDRVKDLKIKLNACSSNREYQAFKEQIAADEQANSVLTDEILELYEKQDELKVKVATAEDHLKKGKEESERTRARVQEQQQSLESEVSRVSAELTREEERLPVDMRADYYRLTKARGDKAMAPVDGDCCGGCYQMLTAQNMNELYMLKPLSCKNCGCLLYLPEGRVPGKHR